MGTEQNREAALSRLLTEVFDGDGAGLLRWVRLHLGKRIHDELSTGGSLSQLAFDITVAIERHGLANQAFTSLSEERSGQIERIQEVARLWGAPLDQMRPAPTRWTNGHEQKAVVSAGDSVQLEAEKGPSASPDHTALLTAAVHTLYERFLPHRASEEHTAAVVRHLSASTGESSLHRAMGLAIGNVETFIGDIALCLLRPKLFAQSLFYMSKSKLLSLAQTTHRGLFEPSRLAGRVDSAVERLVRIHESYLSNGKLRFVVWPPANALQSDDLCLIVASIVMTEARSKAEFLATPSNQVLQAATLDKPYLSFMLSRKHVLVNSVNYRGLSHMVAGRPRYVLALGYAEQLSITQFRLSPLALGLLQFNSRAIE